MVESIATVASAALPSTRGNTPEINNLALQGHPLDTSIDWLKRPCTLTIHVFNDPQSISLSHEHNKLATLIFNRLHGTTSRQAPRRTRRHSSGPSSSATKNNNTLVDFTMDEVAYLMDKLAYSKRI